MNTKAKLTCCITGESRQSSHKYIAAKAERNNTTPEEFSQYYVTKQAYGNLKKELNTKPVKVVLNDMNADGQTVEKILRYNGKSTKTLDDFKGKKKEVATEAQTLVEA
jgi:hypothetical protein